MASVRKLKAAVVGLGIGLEHARALSEHPDCELCLVYDIDVQKARMFAQENEGVLYAESYDEILLNQGIDLVSIASYDDAHFAQVLGALHAGKHVFVEKPLCRGLTELGEVKRAWVESGVHLASNLVLRAAPLYKWLKGAIEAGELGEVYAFDGDYLYGRLTKVTEGWRRDVFEYSVIEGGGIHLVDLMLWLTGQTPVEVAAAGNRISTVGTLFRYHDFIAATFRFESGLVGRITANFGSVHPHQHVVRVFGTKGTFIYDDQGARLHRTRNPETTPQLLPYSPFPASRGDLIPSFVEAIRKEAGAADTQSHFDAVCVCSAADQAVNAKFPVDVTYL